MFFPSWHRAQSEHPSHSFVDGSYTPKRLQMSVTKVPCLKCCFNPDSILDRALQLNLNYSFILVCKAFCQVRADLYYEFCLLIQAYFTGLEEAKPWP